MECNSESSSPTEGKQRCLICLDSFLPIECVSLLPCTHTMCEPCFQMFPQKLQRDRCPCCTSLIQTYSFGGQEAQDY